VVKNNWLDVEQNYGKLGEKACMCGRMQPLQQIVRNQKP
jgi:hypothetical protein